MSTDYRSLQTIQAAELFDGRLEQYGVSERVNEETTTDHRLLTDGNNFFWTHTNKHGVVDFFTRFYPNGSPGKIIDAIEQAFDTEIVSEYDCRFWGFDTEEEWDEAQRRIAEEHQDEYHRELLKFLRGEPSDIQPGTIGEIKANLAKELVAGDPAMLDDREKLHAALDAVYERDYTIKVTRSPQEVEAAKMRVTHENNLPRA